MPNKTGPELAAYGADAAQHWADGRSPTLNEAIVTTVKTANLNEDQVRRVVEATNQAAYLKEHNKEGSEHRVIEFSGGPARVEEVLRHLNHSPGVREYGDLSDYDRPFHKTASSWDRIEAAFAPRTPLSAAELGVSDPYRDVKKLASRVEHMLREAEGEISSDEVRLETATYKLAQTMIQTHNEGVPLGAMVEAWGQALHPAPVFVKTAFERVTPRLTKLARFRAPDAIPKELEKRAAPNTMVDTDHPLIQDFSYFCEALINLGASQKVASDLEGELNQMKVFLKDPDSFRVKEAQVKAEDARGLFSKGRDVLHGVAGSRCVF